MTRAQHPPYLVVTGVTGAGKTTVGRLAATLTGVPFADGDDFHAPDSVAKMSAGQPLTDADRQPWLREIGAWLRERHDAATGAVVACSALKRAYRDTLSAACPAAYFIELAGRQDQIAARLEGRRDHFAKADLLDSQFAVWEPLAPDEPGITLALGPGPERLAREAVTRWTAWADSAR